MTQLSKAMKLERENLQPSPEALLASTSAIALGQLTATFVHEIKNSLNNLNLTVQNIIDDLQTESGLSPNSGYIEKLSVVLSEIRRCDGLSRRLQETALRSLRPEKGEHHINEIVRRSLQLIDTALRRKAITIQARLDPRLDPPAGSAPGIPFSIDANQILQVLLNILQNAIDASPERGRILIETRADAGHAEVRVTDHGEGVPEDIRRKLFKPFSTTKKEGLGLGLFLSRILIEENHGGKIDLQSTKVGAGAT
ncbi:MAG TPA: ATP-binding protein, partial [Thermoanaerobaculia bacterium]|nr:ATP-binding protein [Thermoanaerobaculia bacterium]